MNEDIRETFHSEEYDQFYNSLDEKIKVKYDSQSFMESKRVLFLNSFLKKDTKQYKSEIEIARQIMNKYTEED